MKEYEIIDIDKLAKGIKNVAMQDIDGNLPAGYYGWSGAYGTHYRVDPANRITAVFMPPVTDMLWGSDSKKL